MPSAPKGLENSNFKWPNFRGAYRRISAINWNRLIDKENEFELINDKNIWNKELKHVKSRIQISF
jgi:hypothetical protein